MRAYCDGAIKEANDKLYLKVGDEQNAINTKFNTMLSDSIKRLLDDWNVKINQINENVGNVKELTLQEAEKLYSQRGGNGSPEQIRKAIDGLRE